MRRALSLVELLVVVTVIALLASLLMVAGKRVVDSAKSVRCLGNLRQLAMAHLAYVQDHDGWTMPFAGNGVRLWYQLLPPYLDKDQGRTSSRGAGGVFYDCPGWQGRIADDGQRDLYVARAGNGIVQAAGYAYSSMPGLPVTNAPNGWGWSDYGPQPRNFRLAALTYLDQRMAFGDANFWDIHGAGKFNPTTYERCVQMNMNAYYVSRDPRHRPAPNWAMFSGRALALSRGTNGDASRSFNNPSVLTE